MATLTLAIPDDLKREMDTLPELNWSEIARKAIREKATEYKLFKSIATKSKLMAKDADAISNKIDKALSKAYLK